ncbi:MAG: hypothetical protein LIO78_01145 [Clostridiales bacterium]|nr:hypothetical protein [Clostridiales bacterium]
MITLVSDEKIAETSSKGNQEKWYDRNSNCWYKVDQFGYEALAETFTSILLSHSNIASDTPFSYVRYNMGQAQVHGRKRTCCISLNFLQDGQALVPLNRLLSNAHGVPLKDQLSRLSSNKKRIAYLAEETAAVTGLDLFPQYLTLLFEIDALICNDDRHLNNIAVIEEGGTFSYCPIFDNGAGLLSNVQMLQMDIDPIALIRSLQARPFCTTFNRQVATARTLYGHQLTLPIFDAAELREMVSPLLSYYPMRDRDIISNRVVECILLRQKAL